MKWSTVERFFSVVLTLSCVVLAGVVIKREFFPAPLAASPSEMRSDPERLAKWNEVRDRAVRLTGPADAVVTIVEFLDLECPACRSYHGTLSRVLEEHRTNVELRVFHYPLPRHRFARQAAHALECATRQDRGLEFVGVVLSQQDSVGLVSWNYFAKQAGVSDTLKFEACASTPRSVAIDSGLPWGREIGVTSTPSIAINGVLFPRAPRLEEMRELVGRALRGDDLISGWKR